MLRSLPRSILDDIDASVTAATKANELLRVYAEAERIRQKHVAENIALEDIVEEILLRSTNGPGLEVDIADAASAILGTDGATIAVSGAAYKPMRG